MICEGKIGCHDCLGFLQGLEVKLDHVLQAVDKEATPKIKETVSESVEYIKAFKKGG